METWNDETDGGKAIGGTSRCCADLAVFVATEDSYHVVGFELISGGGA